MSYYGYITDNTYQVADTAITWDFVRYDEEETPFSYVGIESLVEIDSTKVVMFETGQSGGFSLNLKHRQTKNNKYGRRDYHTNASCSDWCLGAKGGLEHMEEKNR